jgi:hypothetical protein
MNRKLASIGESLDILIKLTALNIGKDTYFKDRERKEQKVEALSDMGIPDRVIAIIVGSSAESVQALRSRLKRKKEGARSTREIEFQTEDLQDVLNNAALFSSTRELIEFASQMNLSSGLTVFEERDRIISRIIEAFQNSDRIKQALFIQALERRAENKSLKDTDFLRFLEAWERHIKGGSSVDSRS